MSTGWLIVIVLASGVGTLLLRLLPMLWQEKGMKEAWRQGARRRALDAIGPSAMVALLGVSFWSMLQPAPTVQSLAAARTALRSAASNCRRLCQDGSR